MLRLVVLAVLLPMAAYAKPPPNADMSLAPWYHGLKQNGTGVSCCDISDCRPTVTRPDPDGLYYDAKTEAGTWVKVPESTILHHIFNPTGQPVLCWTPYLGVMCFVPNAGT